MNFLLAAYLLLVVAATLLGRGTRAGMTGTFLLSLLFTPILTILFLALFQQQRRDHPERRRRYEADPPAR